MIVKFERNYLLALLTVASSQDVRPYLNGVHIDADNNLATATDGHRVIRVPVIIEDNRESIKTLILGIPKIKPTKKHGFIQAEVGRDLNHMNEIIWTYLESNLSQYIMHISKIVDGEYPDINSVIPKESDLVESGEFSFNPKFLGDVPKALGATGIRLWGNKKGKLQSFKVTFDKNIDDVCYIVMPTRV